MSGPSDLDLIEHLAENVSRQLDLLEKLQVRLDRLAERVGLLDNEVRELRKDARPRRWVGS